MNNNTELILIRITGLDRPGLTASITEILSKYDVTILDIGQADIHSTLSLGILFKSQEKDSGNIMKELHVYPFRIRHQYPFLSRYCGRI